MTTIHKGNPARSMSLEVPYIAQHWEILLMCVFLFQKERGREETERRGCD